MSAATLFDRMAANYDAQWTDTPVGRAQRDAVWRTIDRVFQPGHRVLDIGCGTGEDAVHLLARGISMAAIDASPAMVAIARTRGVPASVCAAEDLSHMDAETPFHRARGVPASVCAAEYLSHMDAETPSRLDTPFDGALSNFGALNCVSDLPALAASLAPLVRPGGHLAICLLSRVCLWETLYYALRLQFGKALRRFSGRALAANTLPIYYPSVAHTRAAFAPHFTLLRWSGIGLLVPPSYVKLPAPLVAALAKFDAQLAHLPLLRGLADHRLFLLVRT
ncbi:MAG: methyltransferase domain-containing protein [Candidatus Solibacter sp.]